MTTHPPRTTDDMRIEEGRKLALVCLGNVFDPKDVPDICLVLTHEASDAYDLVLGEGSDVVGGGWCALVGARPEELMGKFAPVARFSRDDLLLTLCVGQHNIITTLTNDELITGVGGDAYDPQPALPQRSARNHRERLAAYAPRCPRFTPGPSFDPRGASKNAQTRPFRRGKGQSRGALSTGETIEH